MAFTELTDDLDIIQALDDQPNDVGGLTAEQLKAKFDEAANAIKDFINDSLIAELEATTNGSSGADNIGATAISGLTGGTVQALLEALKTYVDTITAGLIVGEYPDMALFKSGSSTFTDNDTAQTFTDAFCTTASLVSIIITGTPAGVWTVEAGDGSFTITSSSAESTDVAFDYTITKGLT